MKNTGPIPATPLWTKVPATGTQINSTAISGDGSRVFLGTSQEYGTGTFAVYCYDAAGKLQWSDPISAQEIYQGVFWVALSDNGLYGAAGGESSEDGAGFLRAYNAADGTNLLSTTASGRINQVSLSDDGCFLVAAYANQVDLYGLKDAAYSLLDSYHSSYEINSCEISGNGKRVVLSGIKYSQSEAADDSEWTTTGCVIALNIVNDKLVLEQECPLEVGSMRVAIVADGQWWGASLHDGSCAVFNDYSGFSPVWCYTPDVALSLAYAFAITKTEDGRLIVACGANLKHATKTEGGCLYVMQSIIQHGVPKPQLQWQASTRLGINPGVNMDTNAQYVTATDGSPGNGSESQGHFYLFGIADGTLFWTYPTTVMNWPMAISSSANAIFGASDNGTAYYWGADLS